LKLSEIDRKIQKLGGSLNNQEVDKFNESVKEMLNSSVMIPVSYIEPEKDRTVNKATYQKRPDSGKSVEEQAPTKRRNFHPYDNIFGLDNSRIAQKSNNNAIGLTIDDFNAI